MKTKELTSVKERRKPKKRERMTIDFYGYIEIQLDVVVHRFSLGVIGSLECSSGDGLLLSYDLISCSVQNLPSSVSSLVFFSHLEERSDSVSHSGVNESLGALDVVVEVVTEGLDVVDRLLLLGSTDVRGKENCIGQRLSSLQLTKRDITLRVSCLEVLDTLELKRGLFLTVSDRRCVRHGLASVGILLEEHFGKDDIINILESDGEDNDGSVTLGLDVDGLVVTVVDLDKWTSTLLGLYVGEYLVKGGSEGVSLEEGNIVDNLVQVGGRGSEVNLECGVVSTLSGHLQGSVDLLQKVADSLGPIPVRANLSRVDSLQLLPALDGDGNVNKISGLSNGCNVEDDCIEIGNGHIDGVKLGIGLLGFLEPILEEVLYNLLPINRLNPLSCNITLLWYSNKIIFSTL